MSARRPPRGASWLLRRFVPGDTCDRVLGDLEEVFHEPSRTRGHGSAGIWFWRQVVSFSVLFALERAREAGVALTRGVAPSWLDVKLGGRMLVKSPLLTLTGCVAIATAIGINAGFHEFVRIYFSAATQLESDDGVVRISNYDVAGGGQDPRILKDLARWRDGLETVEQIGAALRLDMGLVLQDPAG